MFSSELSPEMLLLSCMASFCMRCPLRHIQNIFAISPQQDLILHRRPTSEAEFKTRGMTWEDFEKKGILKVWRPPSWVRHARVLKMATSGWAMHTNSNKTRSPEDEYMANRFWASIFCHACFGCSRLWLVTRMNLHLLLHHKEKNAKTTFSWK